MAGPKKTLTKQQAIGVMVVGGIMLILAYFIPTEQGSSAHLWKVFMGFIGFCVIGAGAHFRPMPPKAGDKWVEGQECDLEHAGRREKRPAVRRSAFACAWPRPPARSSHD